MTASTEPQPPARSELTEFGFTFGAARFERLAILADGCAVVRITTTADRVLDVYVSAKGRSVRVFEDGKDWTL